MPGRLRTAVLIAPTVVALTLPTSGVAAPGAAAAPPPRSAAGQDADVLEQVKAIPRVSDVREAKAPAGYRLFFMNFRQYVDHKDARKGTFTQRISLLHRGFDRPTVFKTSGYGLSSSPSASEPTRLVDGNEIAMEHRFFDPSRPANPDWPSQLTIWQAATDQHAITQAFQQLYTRNWLATGASKGGMTATYFRRFYPDDVQGTIPYVAPNDVIDDKDVYNRFLSRVGTASCRDTLTTLQRRVLRDRPWFAKKLRAQSETDKLTYTIVGSQAKSLEASLLDMPFGFWQYSGLSKCGSLPNPANATNEQLWTFLDQQFPLSGYSDQSLEPYIPYYYQAAYQLGSPEPYEEPLTGLLKFPGLNVARSFVPKELRPKTFDTAAMPDIDRFVRTSGSDFLFVYGQNDPWSAEPFRCGAAASAAKRDCSTYTVAEGTHGATISQLGIAERTRATQTVLQFAGLDSTPAKAKQAIGRQNSPVLRSLAKTEQAEQRRVAPGLG